MRPNVVLLLVALPVSLVAGPRAAAQSPETIERVERELAIKRLQGVWVPDLLLTAAGAEKYPLGGRALFFSGTSFVRSEGTRTVAGGTFQAEPGGFLRLTVTAREPWDLEAGVPGREAQEVKQYAYKVDGDVLTLCYSVGNKGKAGDLAPGEGRQVVVYRRQPDGDHRPLKRPKR